MLFIKVCNIPNPKKVYIIVYVFVNANLVFFLWNDRYIYAADGAHGISFKVLYISETGGLVALSNMFQALECAKIRFYLTFIWHSAMEVSESN